MKRKMKAETRAELRDLVNEMWNNGIEKASEMMIFFPVFIAVFQAPRLSKRAESVRARANHTVNAFV